MKELVCTWIFISVSLSTPCSVRHCYRFGWCFACFVEVLDDEATFCYHLFDAEGQRQAFHEDEIESEVDPLLHLLNLDP